MEICPKRSQRHTFKSIVKISRYGRRRSGRTVCVLYFPGTAWQYRRGYKGDSGVILTDIIKDFNYLFFCYLKIFFAEIYYDIFSVFSSSVTGSVNRVRIIRSYPFCSSCVDNRDLP